MLRITDSLAALGFDPLAAGVLTPNHFGFALSGTPLKSASPPLAPVLEQLRSETRDAHERMEALFGMPADVASQCRWLALFLAFLEPLEARLAACLGADHPALQGRSKLAWLRQDLEELGMTPSAVAELPRCGQLPVLATEAEALGAMYVFEGATLGGQFIARHIATRVDPGQGRGSRYFKSYGAEVGPKWQAFRGLLCAAASPQDEQAIVGAAKQTFEAMYIWCGGTP